MILSGASTGTLPIDTAKVVGVNSRKRCSPCGVLSPVVSSVIRSVSLVSVSSILCPPLLTINPVALCIPAELRADTISLSVKVGAWSMLCGSIEVIVLAYVGVGACAAACEPVAAAVDALSAMSKAYESKKHLTVLNS